MWERGWGGGISTLITNRLRGRGVDDDDGLGLVEFKDSRQGIGGRLMILKMMMMRGEGGKEGITENERGGKKKIGERETLAC